MDLPLSLIHIYYNLSNAMIASCMAYKLGVSVSDIQKAIAAFSPVEHRLEYIGEKNGVKFYNDSKATNTHAVTAALNSFDKNIILPVSYTHLRYSSSSGY